MLSTRRSRVLIGMAATVNPSRRILSWADRGRAGGGNAFRRGQFRFAHISVPANLLGALVTFAYFRFIDPGALTGSPGLGEILYFVVFFGALVVVANWLGNRWMRPLRQRPIPPGPAGDAGPPPGAARSPGSSPASTSSAGRWPG